jgi:hypothetical protein
MSAASISSGLSISSDLWSQLQQQQAQRTADQAEQRAQSLQAQARAAQQEASVAQERARTLGVKSSQAQGEASDARRNLAEMESLGKTQSNLTELRGQVAGAVEALSPPSPATNAAAANKAAPVVNAYGQETGTLVNVTA